MTTKAMHPVLAFLLLCLGGPFLGVLIGLVWAVLIFGDVVLSILSWPFRLLGGVAAAVLGGGR